MIIPFEYDDLVAWLHAEPFEAADAIVNLQRSIATHRDALRKLLDEVQWMTGSQDFGPGGKAEQGFNNGTRKVIAECEALLADQ